jgi:hypothetical protein
MLITSSNVVGCSTGSSAGLAPLKNSVDQCRHASIDLADTTPVGHEPACLDMLAPLVHGGQPVLGRQIDDHPPVASENRTRKD